MNKTIIFHDNNLTLRGTSIAVYNYADYNEKILGNKSIIMSWPDNNLNKAKNKFTTRFETYFGWWNSVDLDIFMKKNSVDYFYKITAGRKGDSVLPLDHKSLVHVVFTNNDPHGTKYVYVSDWLAKNQGYDPEYYSVPHIVEKLPPPINNLREQLGIPNNVKVFGCYGGSTEFNIGFVHDAIKNIVNNRKDIIFLFMNINAFMDSHEQVIHLPGTWNLQEKSEFVNACDAMIHARYGGETFGLACAEFALENKPIITYKLSGEANHIEVMGDRGIYYTNYDEVYDIFDNFSTYQKFDDYYLSYLQFSPEIIMNKFAKVFLQ